MSLLLDIVARNRAGERIGIWSACSAQRLVLEACAEHAVRSGTPLLVEATCNQVNQEGGYTGMQPADFYSWVRGLAADRGLPAERLILGGDHLGPNPWRTLPADEAMDRAEAMVRAYVAAAFVKIHLDASMACADDLSPLSDTVIADRAARLCAAAEATARDAGLAPPVYVVGTEVPVPGGAHEALDHVAVTDPADVARTVALHREAFAAHGVASAAERIVAVVVQPGVEFGHAAVVPFDPPRAAALSRAVLDLPGLVYEAHSTDYQTPAALAALVAGHFAVLKVGPQLSFAMREAIFALAAVEDEWLPAGRRSNVRHVLERTMLDRPGHWKPYYAGTSHERRIARAWSLSDRCRYYWAERPVAAALGALVENLREMPPSWPLLSQFLPEEAREVLHGRQSPDPEALIRRRVRSAIDGYARACGA